MIAFDYMDPAPVQPNPVPPPAPQLTPVPEKPRSALRTIGKVVLWSAIIIGGLFTLQYLIFFSVLFSFITGIGASCPDPYHLNGATIPVHVDEATSDTIQVYYGGDVGCVARGKDTSVSMSTYWTGDSRDRHDNIIENRVIELPGDGLTKWFIFLIWDDKTYAALFSRSGSGPATYHDEVPVGMSYYIRSATQHSDGSVTLEYYADSETKTRTEVTLRREGNTLVGSVNAWRIIAPPVLQASMEIPGDWEFSVAGKTVSIFPTDSTDRPLIIETSKGAPTRITLPYVDGTEIGYGRLYQPEMSEFTAGGITYSVVWTRLGDLLVHASSTPTTDFIWHKRGDMNWYIYLTKTNVYKNITDEILDSIEIHKVAP